MKLFIKSFTFFILFISTAFNTHAAENTFDGNSSLMLSIWQEGFFLNNPSGQPTSLIIDTGLRYSDLFNLGTNSSSGTTISTTIDEIIDVDEFFKFNASFVTSNPMMNIFAGSRNFGNNSMFSSSENFDESGTALNVELNNSLNNADLVLSFIPDNNYIISNSISNFPNAGNINHWGDNFGQAFQDIDNTFELVDSASIPNPGGNFNYDGIATGEMMLFQTSSEGTLNGQPLQVDDFNGLFTFSFELETGQLTFTNLGAAAVPLPASFFLMFIGLFTLLGKFYRTCE